MRGESVEGEELLALFTDHGFFFFSEAVSDLFFTTPTSGTSLSTIPYSHSTPSSPFSSPNQQQTWITSNYSLGNVYYPIICNPLTYCRVTTLYTNGLHVESFSAIEHSTNITSNTTVLPTKDEYEEECPEGSTVVGIDSKLTHNEEDLCEWE